MKYWFLLAISFLSITALGQAPPYTKKHFVVEEDTAEFKPSGPVKNGTARTYIKTKVSFYDVDDNNTTHVRAGITALLYIEGQFKNDKKNGLTRQFLIDSTDHSKRYLIAEQIYENDKLNGKWSVYNLKETLVMEQNFKNDSLHGISRQYWIDGRSIMSEREYFNGSTKFIQREFYQNGKVSMEIMFVNNEPNGETKEYYETGVLKDKFNVKNGLRDGLRVYYYPDGKPWIEQIYKDNKPWTIVANYDSKGKKRNAGTLKDGAGTVIYYDDDTTIRETVQYKNGETQK